MEYAGADKGSPLSWAGKGDASRPNDLRNPPSDYAPPNMKQGPTSGILKIDPTAAPGAFVPKKEDDRVPVGHGSNAWQPAGTNLPYAGLNPAQPQPAAGRQGPVHSDPPMVGMVTPQAPMLGA